MYDSPIDKIIGEMRSQLVKNEEGQFMVQVSQTIGYNIDKDELINALNYDRGQYEKGYEDGLNASKWIPVSERLPEELVDVLAYDGVDMFVTFLRKGRWASYNSNFDIYTNILAWMPLPEPYEPQKREDEEC